MHDATDIRPADLELQRDFLRRLARQLVRGEAAAEDLVQDTLVRALERPPASARTLRAWLAAVARRLAINRARGEERGLARERRVARGESVASHDEALASLELQEGLIAAVKALDEPYRTTIWLRFHEGLAPAEIAAHQATPRKTVESRLTRGLALLRSELDRRSRGDRTQWLGGMLLLARSRNSAPLTLGLAGGIAMKKLGVACALVLALAAAWRLLPRAAAPTTPVEGRMPSALEPEALEITATTPPDSRTPIGREPATAVNLAGALRILVRWDDGAPAGDVGLLVFPEDDPLGERHVVRAITDAGGAALVEAIHAGRVRVEADRTGRAGSIVAVVRAGLETQALFELPTGIDVSGRVTDSSGASFAGGEIFLVDPRHDWLATRIVTRSDEQGSYTVRDVSSELSLGASGGDQLAILEALEGRAEPGGTARIDFVLRRACTGLIGRVLGPERLPVRGALVAAGHPQGYPGTYAENADRQVAFGMPVVETDAEGRFQARGVWQRDRGMPVAVLAEGFPVTLLIVPQSLERTSFVEIVLPAPVTLRGFVRDPGGRPLANAALRVRSRDSRGERGVPFPLPSARSDSRGAFQLDLVPPGPALLEVDPASTFDKELFPLDVQGGTMDLVLALQASDVVRGRAEYSDGSPVGDRLVECFKDGDRRASVRTDASGNFEIAGCSDSPYDLRLQDEKSQRTVAQWPYAVPGVTAILQLGRPSGSVTGQLAAAAGAAGSEITVWLDSREGKRAPSPLWSDDRFRFEGVEAGTYRVRYASANLVEEHGRRYSAPLRRVLPATDWFQVAEGRSVDLGLLENAPPGKLVVELNAPPGRFNGGIKDRTFELVSFLERDGTALRLDEISGGEWILDGEWLADAGEELYANICEPFTIRAGETTHLEVTVQRGVPRTLSFSFAEPVQPWNDLQVTLRGADGRFVLVDRLDRRRGTPAGVVAVLPIGVYEVEAVSDARLTARGNCFVPALTEQDAPLVFELR